MCLRCYHHARSFCVLLTIPPPLLYCGIIHPLRIPRIPLMLLRRMTAFRITVFSIVLSSLLVTLVITIIAATIVTFSQLWNRIRICVMHPPACAFVLLVCVCVCVLFFFVL